MNGKVMLYNLNSHTAIRTQCFQTRGEMLKIMSKWREDMKRVSQKSEYCFHVQFGDTKLERVLSVEDKEYIVQNREVFTVQQLANKLRKPKMVIRGFLMKRKLNYKKESNTTK